MEDRIARLEVHVEHMRTDIADIKVDIRRLDQKIDALAEKHNARFDGLAQAIGELKTGRFVDRVWFLLMCGTLLAVMARGFHWI